MTRFTDPQCQDFFDFIDSMETKRYAESHGQVEHARLAFALDAASGQPGGFLSLDGVDPDGAADALRLMMKHGFEAAALVQEGYVSRAAIPVRFEALIVELHRPDAPVARWAREIVTDKDGKRSLGDVVVNTITEGLTEQSR